MQDDSAHLPVSDQGQVLAGFADRWMNAPEALREQALADPQDVAETLRGLDGMLGHRLHSVMHPQALMMAVIVPGSMVIVATTGPDTLEPDEVDWDRATIALRTNEIGFAKNLSGAATRPLWAFASAIEAMHWDLPDPIRTALTLAPNERVLALTVAQSNDSPLKRACAAFSLSGLETRVVLCTLRAGNIRRGAVLAEVQYSTAREAMASALSKVGVRKMPGLIHKVSMLAFGVFPNSAEAAQLLADLWGLSPRQSQIALLLGEGLTRSEAAKVLGISEATFKKQTDVVLQTLGVASAAEVARAISAITTLQALTDASGGRVAWSDHAAEPLRFIRRPDGTRIAISDFGPASGRPVILSHASFSGRHPPRGLTRCLIRAGFRPIAIDRPGYGLSDFDPAIAVDPVGEPYGAAARDMATVLDALGLTSADLIGRGGGQAALAFATLYPQRCGRVILISPIPPTKCDVGWRGLFGAYREIYRLTPELIPHSIRLMSRLMDRAFVARMVRKTLASTPPDLAMASRPGFDDDYYRSMQMYALGKLDGYIHEQRYVISAETDGYAPAAATIHVIYGEHDAVLDVRAARAYWEHRLPDARFEEIVGKGRLLDYDAPEIVANRLADAGA